MFTPDADISPYDGPTSLPTSPPKGLSGQIKHANTRLPEQSNDDGDTTVIVPSSPTRSKIGAAIAGTPCELEFSQSFEPIADHIRSADVSRGERADFPLVPALPSPTPSQLGPAAVSKLMTWGTITSTPRVLSSGADPRPGVGPPTDTTAFHLPAPTQREKVAHKLSSTASRSLRAKASLLSGTPGPSRLSLSKGRQAGDMTAPDTPRPHPGLLTPAAKRLLDRTAGLGTSAARRAEVMHQGSNWEGAKSKARDIGKVRWTPSPSPASRGVP